MAENVISKLKTRKGNLKGKLTRLENYVKGVNQNDLNDNIINEIQARLEKLQLTYNEFDELQIELDQKILELSQTESDENVDLVTAESRASEAEEAEFESRYFKLVGQMNALLKCYNIGGNNGILNQQSLGDSMHNVASDIKQPIAMQSLVRLPSINLPVFDGKYSNWLEFKDSFNALVDGNLALNNIQKFYYLRSSLSKEVLGIIKSLEVTDTNYNIAWQFLRERFENKGLIIYNHLRAIFEHPILNKESFINLRDLYDEITKHLRALKSLGEKTESWDRLIIYIMSSKFDNITRRDWEVFKCEGDLPTMIDLNRFLKNKCEVLEKLEITKSDLGRSNNFNTKPPFYNKNQNKSSTSSNFASTSNNLNNNFKCYFCKQTSHGVFKCHEFLNLPVNKRINAIKQLKLCLNCFKNTHSSWECPKPKCSKCQKPHNSILHLDFNSLNQKSDVYSAEKNTAGNALAVAVPTVVNQKVTESDVLNASNCMHNAYLDQVNSVDTGTNNDVSVMGLSVTNKYSQVLLSTALIKIKGNGKIITARALLDSGSQSNFLSQNICNKLNLNKVQINHAVKGVGETLTNIQYKVNLNVESYFNNFVANIDCLVIPKITENLPLMSFNKNMLKIPQNLELADPNYNISGEIDILLGSNIFWSILGSKQVRLGPKLPLLHESKFGYIIAGELKMNMPSMSSSTSLNCLNILDADNSIDNKIVKFWEIEEVNNKINNLSESEKYCERFFQDTTKRDKNGRFIVRIPFNNKVELLGDSQNMALKRFLSLEQKLNKNVNLKSEYVLFMNEYEELGHMSETKDTEGMGYYLPHHAIIKSSSITTKCRVVFDASAKTTSGYSLNDVQHIGPTLQQDVFSILTRFRTYKYVMTGDISKMYRQILVDLNETKYQKIFWREDCRDDIKVFKLNTITYGTASAPYLAVRCLIEIANENEINYPVASKIIKRDFYMDDLLTGSNSESELLTLQKDITSLLASYGFELRKFLCNNKELLNKFQIIEGLESSILNIGENESNKTLGVYWDSNNDYIKYKINLDQTNNFKITKRSILSLICQIFDPLGLLGPIIIIAKLIIQNLWKLKLDWDDDIPDTLLNTWTLFYNNLSNISNFKISRCAIFSQYIIIEMHGFCDSSIKAYGACIYLRCLTVDGKYYSRLLCAKSRVAPLKQISLPRLELSGALLLANLSKKLFDTLEINFHKFYFWSDSTITLCWIRGESSKWKTFVANRVSEIRSLTSYQDWNYVKSTDNPADLLSRGTTIAVLENSDLWWYGPVWLSQDNFTWNTKEPEVETSNILEQKVVSLYSTNYSSEIISILNHYSSFRTTLNIIAYILRFKNNLKLNKADRIIGPIKPEELEGALLLLIQNIQIQSYSKEYSNISKNKCLDKSSKLLSLNPFLHKGVLRVGGRINKSDQSFDVKHPIILPQNNFLTTQILRHEHQRLFHCGAQNLLYSIREKYWPISGRNACKKIVRECVKCFRVCPKDNKYLMGELPTVRVTSHSVFQNVGTDFGGPFLLKDRLTRGAKIVKAYMCLFICMSTKAVHIELVSDLTRDAFMAAFKRFISRRGKPSNIYSDNGSNYKGANTELTKLYNFLAMHSDYIANQLAPEYIKWHFIPASSPSFGGIWEAGIKSAKSHIKRVVGDNRLTFEEFATILTQIEAVLNSRPLCPLTHEPDDISALTPGHFLVGKPLTSLPELDVTNIPENRLTKWKHLQAMSQHFWKRWQKEYLSELQTRIKWKQQSQNLIKVGTLVLVKNDNASPMHWQLGRVTALCPGQDGVVRVVNLKMNDGVVSRAINRVCALPIE